jgi:hypothetical protein
MGLDATARCGKPSCQLQQPVVFQSITLHPPLFVVEVLPPAGVIGADRLQVTVGNRADPDLFPGRRDNQQLATLALFRAQAIS